MSLKYGAYSQKATSACSSSILGWPVNSERADKSTCSQATANYNEFNFINQTNQLSKWVMQLVSDLYCQTLVRWWQLVLKQRNWLSLAFTLYHCHFFWEQQVCKHNWLYMSLPTPPLPLVSAHPTGLTKQNRPRSCTQDSVYLLSSAHKTSGTLQLYNCHPLILFLLTGYVKGFTDR